MADEKKTKKVKKKKKRRAPRSISVRVTGTALNRILHVRVGRADRALAIPVIIARTEFGDIMRYKIVTYDVDGNEVDLGTIQIPN